MAEPIYIDRSLTDEVLSKGRPVIRNGQRSRSADSLGKMASKPSGTLMIAPLLSKECILGFIYIDCLPGPIKFGEDDLEVLNCIVGQLALYIHNNTLLEQLRGQSRTKQDLEAAREVQKRFLPRNVPKLPGFSFMAHYDPCQNVGGDLYDFIPFDDNRLGIIIGDVSGKGFAAALVMAWVVSQLKLAAFQEPDPAKVLARVNQNFLDAQQENLFVTLIYGLLDWKHMTFRFCNAGHIPPLVYRWSTRTVDIIEEGAGMPVGMIPNNEFVLSRITLNPGDTVVLVTDGITEAMNPQGEMLGMEGLNHAIAASLPPAVNIVGDVLAEMRNFVKDRKQYDDITIVAAGAEWAMDDEPVTVNRFFGWPEKKPRH
jgi:serine phosphatase RsbU (regulator of sigma subunit)